MVAPRSCPDRLVFGERINRYQLLTSFGATLEQAVDLDALLPRLAGTVHRGLGAAWVRVSLRGERPGSWLPEPMGLAGTPSGSADLVEELRHHDEVVGRIECGPTEGGYDEADRELLTVLAGQAATAIRFRLPMWVIKTSESMNASAPSTAAGRRSGLSGHIRRRQIYIPRPAKKK